MSKEVPALNANKAPDGEFYVMECTLTVRRTEILNNTRTEKEAEFNGYLSKEVLGTALGILREVIK